MIRKEQFQRWKDDAVTKEFFQVMREDLDKLAHGNMADSFCRDQIGNAETVGQYLAIMRYFNMDYTFLTGENDEPDRD